VQRRWVFVVAILTASACGLFPSLDDLTSGPADVTVETLADAAVDVALPLDATNETSDAGTGTDADAGPCPSLHGPSMVYVPANGGGFCIDSTEVTTTQYAEFVSAVAKGATVVQPSANVCQWNVSVTPLTSGDDGCTTDTTNPIAHANRPVSCVNWCDAYAFCAWAGKRMCGSIDAGVLPFNAPITNANQAYVACSANATQTYPYGKTYIKGYCNTKDLYDGGSGAVADTKAFAQCVGGFPGIYDLTGNVEEWIDSCAEGGEGGTNDTCHESGDCFDYTTSGPARCDNDDSDYRTWQGTDVGIRCCSP
jgi:formylglycine-generating enzyme required for sulfatase activity